MTTTNTFCRLLGNIVIKIHVENTCSAKDHYLAWPPKLLWGTESTDGNTAFDFIDVICEWEGKNCTDVKDIVLHQVVLNNLWPCQLKHVSTRGSLKKNWPCLKTCVSLQMTTFLFATNQAFPSLSIIHFIGE